MFQDFKRKPAYYSVHALRDGTIWFAAQVRKPPKNKKPKIDEDGVCRWFLDETEPCRLSDSGKSVRHTAVAVALNTKKLIRDRVEKKLDLILKRLDDISERLESKACIHS